MKESKKPQLSKVPFLGFRPLGKKLREHKKIKRNIIEGRVVGVVVMAGGVVSV